MHAYYERDSRYLVIDVADAGTGVDTLDVAPRASVVVDRHQRPVSIEIPGEPETTDEALRAVVERWPVLDVDDLLAAAHAAHAAPDRDVTISTRVAA